MYLTLSFLCKHTLRVAGVVHKKDPPKDCGEHTHQITLLFDLFQMLVGLCKHEREGVHRLCGERTLCKDKMWNSMPHNVVMCAITSHVNQMALCDHITICAPSSCLLLFSSTKHGAVCAEWSHQVFASTHFVA